ncbi:MAG: hypothetical protein NTU85_01465 [Candidatus Kaiserbacteria bacterium]|nr:hypothetical protein [Candidatus Kaiserbacteria bacterium]
MKIKKIIGSWKFVIALGIIAAILVIFVCFACAAPAGKPFLHGISSPEELASKIEASLAKNPKGTSMLDPVRCKRDGSCATPSDYFEMFKVSDPAANLTEIANVPAFLRTLEVVPAPGGEYWISCLKPSGKGTFKPTLHCLSRSFKSEEKVWVDPKTKRIVLASDCTNPVEKPIKERCVEIHFFTKAQDTAVRFALLGPTDVSNECIGVKRAGETDFESIWAKECENMHCDFSADVAVVGQPVQLKGSYAPAPGEHVLRLPAFVAEKGSKFVTVLCLDRGKTVWPELPKGEVSFAQATEYGEKREEWIASHSDGIGVRWFDYLNTKSGIKKATVWYTQGEIPKGMPQLYWPWGEWAR